MDKLKNTLYSDRRDFILSKIVNIFLSSSSKIFSIALASSFEISKAGKGKFNFMNTSCMIRKLQLFVKQYFSRGECFNNLQTYLIPISIMNKSNLYLFIYHIISTRSTCNNTVNDTSLRYGREAQSLYP